MRNDEVIKSYEHRARAATSPAKYDKILEEAKALLNEDEYATLLGHLQESPKAEFIARALELLSSGILPAVISARLVEEFGVTPEEAQVLTNEAIQRHNFREEQEESGE